jgi:hypothetical protein
LLLTNSAAAFTCPVLRPLPSQSPTAAPEQQQIAAPAATGRSAAKQPTAAPAATAAAGLTGSISKAGIVTATEAAAASAVSTSTLQSSAAAAQVWALSVAHAAQDVLLQLQHFALAPASTAAANTYNADQLQQPPISKTITTPAATAVVADPAVAAARQAAVVPVAGLDVGSDAMSAETVAALRALLSSGGPLALPAVLAATAAAAAAAALLVALASAASGNRSGVCASCLLVVHA